MKDQIVRVSFGYIKWGSRKGAYQSRVTPSGLIREGDSGDGLIRQIVGHSQAIALGYVVRDCKSRL